MSARSTGDVVRASGAPGVFPLPSSLVKFPTIVESIRRHRLASLSAWHDRLVIWAAAALAGLCVVGFTLLCDQAIALYARLRVAAPGLAFLAAPLGAMVIVWCTRRFAPRAAGSGIPQVMSALDAELPVSLARQFVSIKLSVLKSLLTAAGFLCGFSIGREGPSVQIAAGIMNGFRARFGPGSVVHSRDLVLAGGAAGIAAAFNAPLAGVMFAIEELSRRFEQRASGLITTAIIIAGVVAISIQGNYTYFGRIRVSTIDRDILPAAILCALSAGALGGLFARLLIVSQMSTRSPLTRLRSRRPVLFAGACGLMVALLGWVTAGAANGSGFASTRALLAGQESVPLVYVGVKFMATWLSYWSGVPGGIFAPCVAIGAGLGNDIASLTHLPYAVPMIALGMVGFLAAVTQAPITSFIIVMEMIDGHSMVLSLMATALAASIVSRMISPPLYATLSQLQLAQFGIEGRAEH